MPRKPRINSWIVALVALGGLQACSPTEGGILIPGFGPGAAVAVIVSPSAASIEVGLTVQMSATLVDGVGREVFGDVSWTSSDDNVATVNDQGLVAGVAAGVATITATSGTIFRDANVVVVDSSPPEP